ncbi:MAG TPA: hypothetical protein VIO39_01945 [Methylotenera sp.]
MESFEQPYKKVSRFKALLLFFFSPKHFKKYAAKHDMAWILSTSPDLLAKYQNGEYQLNTEEYEDNAKKRASLLRASLFQSGLVVLLAAIFGVLAGVLFQNKIGPLDTFFSNILQAISVGIILWATLWQLTRDVQSYGGKSLPERVHGWIFNSLYTTGTFILFVVYGWQA